MSAVHAEPYPPLRPPPVRALRKCAVCGHLTLAGRQGPSGWLCERAGCGADR